MTRTVVFSGRALLWLGVSSSLSPGVFLTSARLISALPDLLLSGRGAGAAGYPGLMHRTAPAGRHRRSSCRVLFPLAVVPAHQH